MQTKPIVTDALKLQQLLRDIEQNKIKASGERRLRLRKRFNNALSVMTAKAYQQYLQAKKEAK